MPKANEFGKQPEVFSESVERRKVQDIQDYVLHGGPIGERRESWHTLHRLRFQGADAGVSRDLVATVHARIIAREIAPDGKVLAVVAGRGRWGNTFLFRCPLRWLESGASSDVARVASLIYCRGGAGSFIMPGMHAAFCRAVVQLSNDEEPMPSPVQFSNGAPSGTPEKKPRGAH